MRSKGDRYRQVFIATLLATASMHCRSVRPIFDADENPATRGTLNGTVRGPENSAPVVDRQVEAVRITDGRRYTTKTSSTGGFTFLVSPGRYRLGLSLASAEKILSQPGIIDVSPGALVKDADFVMGGAGVPDN